MIKQNWKGEEEQDSVGPVADICLWSYLFKG